MVLSIISIITVLFYGSFLVLTQLGLWFAFGYIGVFLFFFLFAWSVFYGIFTLVQSIKYKKYLLLVLSTLIICFCLTNILVLAQALGNFFGTDADVLIKKLYVIHILFSFISSVIILVWSIKLKAREIQGR